MCLVVCESEGGGCVAVVVGVVAAVVVVAVGVAVVGVGVTITVLEALFTEEDVGVVCTELELSATGCELDASVFIPFRIGALTLVEILRISLPCTVSLLLDFFKSKVSISIFKLK